MNNIILEILQCSYWEHFKKAKDMALIYPIEHPDRKAVEKELQVLIEKINQLNKNERQTKIN